METFGLTVFMVLCLGSSWSTAEVLQRHKRNWIIDSFSIDEGYTGPFPLSLGKITVEKKYSRFKIRGEAADLGILAIDENTGELSLLKPVDYESKTKLELMFQAYDREKDEIDTQLGIEILILDDNDNRPNFTLPIYRISIAEATYQGSELLTIQAVDRDAAKENKVVDLRIISVIPQPEDLTFYLLNLNADAGTGTISFKGCLDHEKAPKYTLIIEAKDRGKRIQLSSTCSVIIDIQDGNNHIPMITGFTGPNRVKEGVENFLVSNIAISDQDMGLEARKVQFTINGDKNNNFEIVTSEDASQASLYVIKALDYEEHPEMVLNISVENVMPYSTCKVVKRSSTGLWQVVISKSSTISGLGETTDKSLLITKVIVENVNEAPVFKKENMVVMVQENVKIGTYVETVEATDPDVNSDTLTFHIHDEHGWVKVDSQTGQVTTNHLIDREANFVNDSTYTVLLYAVDNGKPAMTGTTTLTLIINDENDNVPELTTTEIVMCQTDDRSKANLTAFDADAPPYGGPFRFKLLGDVENKWKVEPQTGYTVNLVKEVIVHSGVHHLSVEVMDLQSETFVHNLTVKVCECLDPKTPNCDRKIAFHSKAGGATIGIVFLSILLLAGLLLLAFFMSCKEKIKTTNLECESSGHLMTSNTETPGTDCMVGSQQSQQKVKKIYKIQKEANRASMKGFDMTDTSRIIHGGDQQMQWMTEEEQYYSEYHKMRRIREQEIMRRNSARLSMGNSSTMRTDYMGAEAMNMDWGGYDESFAYQTEILHKVIETMQHKIQSSGEEQYDYDPHVYAEEGEEGSGGFELDAISIKDIGFDANSHLDLKFTTLAEICMAEMPKNIVAHHRASSSVVETLPTSPYSTYTTSSSVWEKLPSPAYHTTSINVLKTQPITPFDSTSSSVVETHKAMKMHKTQQKFHQTGYVEYSGASSQQEMGGSFFFQ